MHSTDDTQPNASESLPTQEKPIRTLADVKAETGVQEFGGPKGPEPTRYGDWEKKGRCIDF